MRDDHEQGGLLAMFLAFCTFVGALTILLTIWVIWVIKTREAPKKPLQIVVAAAAVPPLATPTCAPPIPTEACFASSTAPCDLVRPDIRHRRVSFKPSNRALHRMSNESETVSTSSADSGGPETPNSARSLGFGPVPRVSSPDREISSILCETGYVVPGPSRPPARKRFSGLKALGRGSTLSRESSPAPRSRASSRASSPEPAYRAGAASDGEMCTSKDRHQSFARIMRNLGGKKHKKTKSEIPSLDPSIIRPTSPSLSPLLPMGPPPSAFKPSKSRPTSLMGRVMRRTSNPVPTPIAQPKPSRTDPYGPEYNFPMPRPNSPPFSKSHRPSTTSRASHDRSRPGTPLMDYKPLAMPIPMPLPTPLPIRDTSRFTTGHSIERPASAPLRRPELTPSWTAPLDRHQLQARAQDQFGVWKREMDGESVLGLLVSSGRHERLSSGSSGKTISG